LKNLSISLRESTVKQLDKFDIKWRYIWYK
jgi:hypothetical protein